MPSPRSAFAVPPLERIWTPRAARAWANVKRPVLSETEIRAVVIAMGPRGSPAAPQGQCRSLEKRRKCRKNRAATLGALGLPGLLALLGVEPGARELFDVEVGRLRLGLDLDLFVLVLFVLFVDRVFLFGQHGQ